VVDPAGNLVTREGDVLRTQGDVREPGGDVQVGLRIPGMTFGVMFGVTFRVTSMRTMRRDQGALSWSRSREVRCPKHNWSRGRCRLRPQMGQRLRRHLYPPLKPMRP
jgi:hypothetical protein